MTRIAIHVDDRERASAVFELLGTAPEFVVTVMRLKLGDYLLDGRFLFERKTAADLAASIISARLFSQALRLATSPLRSALIIEGTEHDLAQTGMSWESVQGALISVAFFCGIPVLRTRSPEETVRTMRFTARQGHARALGALPRAGYRPRGKRARQLYILQGLPGIGPERARRLLAHFSSVAAVMTANVDALCAVPGVGKDTAEKLRWSVEEPAVEYSLPIDDFSPEEGQGGRMRRRQGIADLQADPRGRGGLALLGGDGLRVLNTGASG